MTILGPARRPAWRRHSLAARRLLVVADAVGDERSRTERDTALYRALSRASRALTTAVYLASDPTD